HRVSTLSLLFFVFFFLCITLLFPPTSTLFPYTTLFRSVRIQFLVVRLFEAARGLKLIPGEHTLESIAQSIKAIEDRRRQLLKKRSEERRVGKECRSRGAP